MSIWSLFAPRYLPTLPKYISSEWFLLLLLLAEPDVARAPDADNCLQPLGMEHGHISDESVSASSAFDHKSVGPQNGR